jgi:hypothetical protein
MNVEIRLRKLESHYRAALSATVAAKARYLAIEGELGSTAAAIARAEAVWQRLELRKASLVAQMAELERFEQTAAV